MMPMLRTTDVMAVCFRFFGHGAKMIGACDGTPRVIRHLKGGRNMCLAVPHKIVRKIDDNSAVAAAGPVETEIRTDLLPDVEIGDVVLVHAGFAIEMLDPSEEAEITQLWEEIRRLAADANEPVQ
jgi:hydrogenase expression/formation protein HypC